MRIKVCLFVFFLLIKSSLLFSQVAINVDGSAPNNSAMLDVKSNNKGFLPPRMTKAAMNAIPNPADGLIVYCTDCRPDGKGVLSTFADGNWNSLNLNCYAPIVPLIATNVASDTGIVWDWKGVPYATGYKWNISNDYTTATQMDTVTTKTETGLACSTAFTRYVWAYNACGNSLPLTLTQTTLACKNSITDIDGNVYKTVTIGTQTWMAENLKTTKYRNGDPIPNISDNTEWAYLATGAFCWYNNNESTNKSTYGGLYNWFAVNDSRNIAPVGWHVPTDAEWTTLTSFLGGENVAGAKLKETGTAHWPSPNTVATNSTGFTTLPGGFRDGNGTFNWIGIIGGFWNATPYSTSEGWYRYLLDNNAKIVHTSTTQTYGWSVRCIKDTPIVPVIPTLSSHGPIFITTNTATSGGNISSDGGSAITSRGVCWETTSTPTIDNPKTTDGTGTGGFISNITGLTVNTTYYLRAYATNSAGTGYGNEFKFNTLDNPAAITFNPALTYGTVADVDGNVYKTITIGTQTWMAENLKTTKYRNGDPIPLVTDNTSWVNLANGAYCLYNNDAANKQVYGSMYNWYAVADNRNLAPTGWHVATDAEWTTLITYLGGDNLASGELKETGTSHWMAPNTGATNNSGFTSLPGGLRNYSDGQFDLMGNHNLFWSSTTSDDPFVWGYDFFFNNNLNRGGYYQQVGASVRCIKDSPVVPVVTTTVVSSIAATTATSGGNVTIDNSSAVLARGVCWATSQNPTIANSKTSDGTGTGTFTSNLTGLLPGTTYYVKAYATNSVTTTYGNQQTLTTTPGVPILTTVAASAIASTTATCGGNISTDGGSAITVRGVCWATTQTPTIANSKTANGTGIGLFTSNLTGLTRATTYYIRAYATNGINTSYGGQETFTTLAEAPVVTTTAITGETNTTATSGGTVTSDGGSVITAKGVCWATTSTPTILNSKTTDGTGTSTFISNISGLTSGTTYHLRAYATNSIATSYGTEVSFTPGTVTDIDGNLYHYIVIGTQTWMVENLKTTKYRNGDAIASVAGSWASLVTGAYSWYNNDPANKAIYGGLYNWYAVADSRNIAPVGWHVPTDAEWTTLTDYLGGQSVAGGKLKEAGTSHWITPNTDATNSSGFTALPGGYRDYGDGAFGNVGGSGYWWSSTASGAADAWYRSLFYHFADAYRYYGGKQYGFSVRCVRD